MSDCRRAMQENMRVRLGNKRVRLESTSAKQGKQERLGSTSGTWERVVREKLASIAERWD